MKIHVDAALTGRIIMRNNSTDESAIFEETANGGEAMFLHKGDRIGIYEFNTIHIGEFTGISKREGDDQVILDGAEYFRVKNMEMLFKTI